MILPALWLDGSGRRPGSGPPFARRQARINSVTAYFDGNITRTA
jgi:hypothetical protein